MNKPAKNQRPAWILCPRYSNRQCNSQQIILWVVHTLFLVNVGKSPTLTELQGLPWTWWYGYGSIPIDTFLVGWTSIYQLFWGSLGTRVLTHPHIHKLKYSPRTPTAGVASLMPLLPRTSPKHPQLTAANAEPCAIAGPVDKTGSLHLSHWRITADGFFMVFPHMLVFFRN